MSNENIYKTRMCIQTYINLYGTVPGIQEMVNWTGMTSEEVQPVYRTGLKPKSNELAA